MGFRVGVEVEVEVEVGVEVILGVSPENSSAQVLNTCHCLLLLQINHPESNGLTLQISVL